MPAGPLLLCAVLRLAEGQVATYQASALTEARGMALMVGGTTTPVAEIEVDPRIGIQYDTPTLNLSAAYAPRLWLTTQVSGLQVLHRSAVQGTFRPDPLYRLLASATFAHGTSNLLAPRLAGPGGVPPGPLQTVGAQTSIPYVFGEVAAGVDSTPTQRTRVALGGTYLVDGGSDAKAQLTFPQQRGPSAAMTFGWRASADDQLDTLLTALHRTFVTGAVNPATGAPIVKPPVWIATLSETWRRKYDLKLSSWVGAGASYTSTELPGGVVKVEKVTPLVDVGGQYLDEDGLKGLRLTFRYAPIVDAVSGRVYQRADSFLLANWASTPTWRMVGELATAVVIGGFQSGQVMVSGEARMARVLSRDLDLIFGVRSLLQRPPNTSFAASYRQWGLFVALSFHDRGTI